MSSLFSPVLACHELSFVSSSIFISLTLVRKELTFWTVCGDVLTSGLRISARYFDKPYVGDPGNETIGRSGTFSLCTFGKP